MIKKTNKGSIQKGKTKKKNIWKLHLKKFTKTQKGRFNTYLKTSNNLLYGYFGIKTLESGILYKKHLELIIRHLKTYFTKLFFKFWIRFHLFFPLTEKSIKSRMGKGKGEVKEIISKISTGKILMEFIWRVKKLILRKTWSKLLLLITKLPFKVTLFWHPISTLVDINTDKHLFGF